MENIFNLPEYNPAYRPPAELPSLEAFREEAEGALARGEDIKFPDHAYRVDGRFAGIVVEDDVDAHDAALSITTFYSLAEAGLTLEAGDLFYCPDDGGFIVVSCRVADRPRLAK